MASVKDTFNAVISDAIKNADLISDNYQKAMAMASIAQALAATGLINEVAAVSKEEKKEEPAKTKKTADKMKRQPKELPPEKEEPAAAPVEEKEEWTEEWTDEAVEALAEELQYITDFTEKYGEEGANACLAEFSNGLLTDVTADINPLNIKGIVAAFHKLEEDAESAS